MKMKMVALGALVSMALGGCSEKKADAPGGQIAAASPAGGNDAPMPKPGLWETTASAEGMPKAMTVQMCLGAPPPGANPFTPPPRAGQQCSNDGLKRSASGYSIDMSCKMNGVTMVSKGEVTGDFSTGYKTVMTTRMSGPNIPAELQAERVSTAESKYIGACPAGMKPGAVKQVG